MCFGFISMYEQVDEQLYSMHTLCRDSLFWSKLTCWVYKQIHINYIRMKLFHKHNYFKDTSHLPDNNY